MARYYRTGGNPKITEEMAQRACELGEKVVQGSLARARAISMLADMGMDPGSAGIYLSVYRMMLNGDRLTYHIKKGDVDLFLEYIYEMRGKNILARGISSLAKFVKYQKDRGVSYRGFQAILEMWQENYKSL